MPGAYVFPESFVQQVQVRIEISGIPRLFSRGKDSRLFNTLFDHYAVTFCTGAGGTPLPDDITFELQVQTGHHHNPITYRTFCNGEVPEPYPIEIDSKRNVIDRLDAFYKDPKPWRVWFNCEHFGRWLMTGKSQSTQVDNAIKNTMMVLEVVASSLAEMLRIQREYEEKQRALEALPAPQAKPPPPVQPAIEQPTHHEALPAVAPAIPRKRATRKKRKNSPAKARKARRGRRRADA
jgi:hypothetical protein